MSELRSDEIRWSIEPDSPMPCPVVPGVVPPSGLTASRADLVTWWRWRYAVLKAENDQKEALLVRAITEAQSYREVLRAALVALNDATKTTRRQRETIARSRDEVRGLRKAVTV